MAEIPYVLNNGKLPEYFGTIQQTGVPDAVTHKWLETVGFKSKNDRYLLAFLKDLGFVTPSGSPTDRWRDYRHTSEARGVMAVAVREAYAGLFALYGDAQRKDDEAIRNWMRTYAAKASPVTIDRALATFRAICKLADLESLPDGDGLVESPGGSSQASPTVQVATASSPGAAVSSPRLGGGATININIALELPASASADDYDNLFAAMRRHLIDGPSEDS